MKKAVSLFLIVMGSFCCYPLFAATQIFVKISGLSGTSTATGFNNYSEVAATGSTTITCNTTSASSPCPVSSKEFVFTLTNPDVNTPTLHLRQAQGTVLATVDFVYAKPSGAGGGTYQVYYQVHLENVVIKSISELGGGDDGPSVQISLAFDRMAWKYTPYNASGGAGTSVQGCYNYASTATCTATFPF